ncbi:MAG: adenylate/guanylate cyclase domain-containing protein [Alphaproteobacteria bacterium]
MSTLTAPFHDRRRFGLFAYLGAFISLLFCFWKTSLTLVASLLGLSVVDIDPHLQAVAMCFFAGATVVALFIDRKEHGDNLPAIVAAAALLVIVGTLYGYYHDGILAAGYVLLLIAALLNQNRMLVFLNRTVQHQASELASANDSLEQRVNEQVGEIQRLARLRGFLPGEVADLIMTEGRENLLDSHRSYIACLFCDIRRFTELTENMEPEDVVDILREFHAEVGRLVVEYGGTIGYRAGDGALVFFNDPLPCDDPVLKAVGLALDIATSFDRQKKRWAKLGADVGLGIGLGSGYATLGVIGIEGRFDYTAIGNSVNLAARLSDLAQDGRILMGRRIWAAVENDIVAEAAGTIDVKGLSQPVEVYRLQGLR